MQMKVVEVIRDDGIIVEVGEKRFELGAYNTDVYDEVGKLTGMTEEELLGDSNAPWGFRIRTPEDIQEGNE